MTPLIEILVSIRKKLGMSMDEMSDFLKIPSSTYKTYERGKTKLKTDLFSLYEEKIGIDLWNSHKTAKICFTDAREKLKSLRSELSTDIKIDVYLTQTIREVVYSKKSLKPDFKIKYPGVKYPSFIVRIEIGFVICHNIKKTRISIRNHCLLVMKEDQRVETGYFYTEDAFVVMKGKKVPISAIFKAFIIIDILDKDDLNECRIKE